MLRAQTSTLSDRVGVFERLLADVEKRGVTWQNTRFDRYLRIFRAASSAEYPRRLTHADDSLLAEASIQIEQLTAASSLWSTQEPGVIQSKLALIVAGTDLPATTSNLDTPRNTLAELATGALLADLGFGVVFTSDDEDVTATLDGLLPFAVECKRPASIEAVERNIREMRKQLRGRCRGGQKSGLAVLAVDRISGLAGGLHSARDVADVHRSVELGLARIAAVVREAVTHPRRTGLHLYPTTWLGGLLLVGNVVLDGTGFPVTLNVLKLFSVAPPHATKIVSPMIERIAGLSRRSSTR